jgi:hypothetical protein
MSADKRTVATDALETLGMIIGAGEKRDAIHLAVEPIIAAQRLMPGQDIGVDEEGKASAYAKPHLGIVDPFLKDTVQPGQRFWLIIYPRQIKSLRHVWSHPAFPDEPALADLKPSFDALKAESEEWMRGEAERLDTGYHTLINAARSYVQDGEYLIEGGKFEGERVSSDFWRHWERITGESAGDKFGDDFLSCSC